MDGYMAILIALYTWLILLLSSLTFVLYCTYHDYLQSDDSSHYPYRKKATKGVIIIRLISLSAISFGVLTLLVLALIYWNNAERSLLLLVVNVPTSIMLGCIAFNSDFRQNMARFVISDY